MLDEKHLESGVCRVCGCTNDNACCHPEWGSCWWLDDEQTICSHCGIDEIKNDNATEHPFDEDLPE